ncbi:response regulator [Sphingomonas spermidinifaciens]|uniref:Response regulator n=1 Tax=Sphingomonas spermidinifaciens TaxID=1141889 RepID=A0A2A4B157_9SPHN|nr:response regulator [Sphingomonas spermidinifaciens]PCD02923.1 response regulator [Sphingomonas spermidinifaciens]
MMFGRKKRRITRILIVEDEPLVAFDTEYFLSESGFEVVATLDRVADAVAILTTTEIDLVLVDVELADGSGVSVAEQAGASGALVLFVTGNCPGEARSLAAGCLAKPYPQRDLLTAIDAIEKTLAGKPPKRLPQSFSLFAQAA